MFHFNVQDTVYELTENESFSEILQLFRLLESPVME